MTPEPTGTCVDYLAGARTVRTLTNSELIDQMHAAGVESGDFTRLLDVNDRFGGLDLPTHDPRPTVRYTVGVSRRATLDLSPDASIPFFDLGVAAPCGIELLGTGAVVADFSNDLPPLEVADSFEVFLEGLAREWLAPQLFETSDGRELSGSIADAKRSLEADGHVASASDRWTTWWQTDDYLARLSTMWDYQRTVRFVVWHGGDIPTAFAHVFAN